MRRVLLLAAAAVLAAPGTARGDGLPVGNVDVGDDGVMSPTGSDRYVALTTSVGTTMLARIDANGGEVRDWRWLREPLTIPGVALDGTADGLSNDGRRLVLIRPREFGRFPLRRTRLVAFDARTLKVHRRLTLRGDFSFDALSPDGRRLYLVHYVDRRDPRKYVVRSLDLVYGRMERGAIVDAREPDEDMRGYPLTRVTTDDGRWAYTLYDGVGEPFVHALDTVDRRAFCIDLPMLAGFDHSQTLRLHLRGDTLDVEEGGERAAVIDTHTMHATSPPQGVFGELAVRLAGAATGIPSDPRETH